MQTEHVRAGDQADIIAVKEADGYCQVQEFLAALDIKTCSKVFQLFKMFCDLGQIRNVEKFRKEPGNIWAFKSFQIRIYCFFAPKARKKTIVLTHAVFKKKNMPDKAELQKAEKIFKEFNRKGDEDEQE